MIPVSYTHLYFVGNKEKKEIDLNYPIYINDKSTIYNLSQDITLISQEFEEVAGCPMAHLLYDRAIPIHKSRQMNNSLPTDILPRP